MSEHVYILKPCPFCGGAPSIRRNANDGKNTWWWVRCGICGAETKAAPNVEEMLAAWNARDKKHDE